MPWGITKLNTAALGLPVLVTWAFVPAAPVWVVPTAIVAADPVAPGFPWGPVAPTCPAGTPKLSAAAADVPTLVTVALEPGGSVDVVPTATVAAAPAGPV